MNPHEIDYIRYDRQLKIIGEENQLKLQNAKVICIGAGGLGNPLLLYLAASGIGHLKIIDGDEISISNLHRQILFKESQLGMNKAIAAAENLAELNRNCVYEAIPEFINNENYITLTSDGSLIIDCTDNFNAKYQINNASKFSSTTLISASIHKDDAQIMTLNYPDGPCYECVFPSPPPPELSPTCSEVGVLGVNVGIIGLIQAKQCISYLIDTNNIENFLTINLTTYQIHQLSITKTLKCDKFHGKKSINQNCIQTLEITPYELENERPNNIQLIDVRDEQERLLFSIGGIHLSLQDIMLKNFSLNPNVKTIIYCESGNRSKIAVKELNKQGFINCFNLKGGLKAWRDIIHDNQ